jgi:hypothetical protein
VKREGWLERKEGKIRKKWVRVWGELKAGRLTIYDCEPGGAAMPAVKAAVEMAAVATVEVGVAWRCLSVEAGRAEKLGAGAAMSASGLLHDTRARKGSCVRPVVGLPAPLSVSRC